MQNPARFIAITTEDSDDAGNHREAVVGDEDQQDNGECGPIGNMQPKFHLSFFVESIILDKCVQSSPYMRERVGSMEKEVDNSICRT